MKTYFLVISHSVPLIMKNVSHKIVETLETYFVLNKFFENLVFYAIMLTNIPERSKPQLII
jgi:hypothetical protein